jgi:hypothetical protein
MVIRSSAPLGRADVRNATHGLRRGVHSCAALRLVIPQGLKPGVNWVLMAPFDFPFDFAQGFGETGQALEAVPFHGAS